MLGITPYNKQMNVAGTVKVKKLKLGVQYDT